MDNQRDAILGYVQELHAYYIQLIENNTLMENRYGLVCSSIDEEQVESIMTMLILKKSFWINGSNLQDIVKRLQPLASNYSRAC